MKTGSKRGMAEGTEANSVGVEGIRRNEKAVSQFVVIKNTLASGC